MRNILFTKEYSFNTKISALLFLIFFFLTVNTSSQERSGLIEAGLNNTVVLDIDIKSGGLIPEEIFTYINLEELKISGNENTILPENIKKLTSLQILDLSSVQVNELPGELSQLRHLREIHLNYELWQYRLDEVRRITRAQIILK